VKPPRTNKGTPNSNSESQNLLQRSCVYEEFLLEKQEIQKLKWLESEKSGSDIGYEKALFIWARAHRRSWKTARLKARHLLPASGRLIAGYGDNHPGFSALT